MTYSIVATCPDTGQIGVAVQSHWFAAGVVCWAKAGIGAVATQAMALIDHGPLGIELMQDGEKPQEAMKRRLSLDGENVNKIIFCVLMYFKIKRFI